MKQRTSSPEKMSHTTTLSSSPAASAGPNGIAIAPPPYGMEVVDHQPVQAASKPGQGHQPLESVTWPMGVGTIQRKVVPPGTSSSGTAGPQKNETGLPDTLKAGIENLSGLSLDDVRVHYNSSKPAQLQAFAYTKGTDIHVGPGHERYLPHEAWHVVQQKQGRVKPTLQAKGVSINDDRGLEREADIMGMKGLKTRDPEPSKIETTVQPVATVQRATASPFHIPSTGQNVVQLASTKLSFETNLTGKNKITATQHTRSGVHKIAADWVLTHGAWKTVPGGEVCNHSKGYDAIAQEILNKIHDKKLHKAAKTVKDIYETLEANNQGIGKATSTHANRMQNVIDDPDDDVNGDDIVDSFNYYIYKICDYPRNLFFWPNRTGGDPDSPQGEYGDDPTGPWEVSNSIISKKTRLSREKGRLKDGRDDLVNALP